MRIQFIGCGDAFGSGGRFNTCFHVSGQRTNFLLDCGASSLIALKRSRIDLNSISMVLITHFHADHFGGVPFFILDAQFSKRTQPLSIAGPPGLPYWFEQVMETGFPGSSRTKQRFEISLVELQPRETASLGEIKITPFHASHGNPSGPCFAYRIEAEGRTMAYTGDTEWTDELIEAGRDADLFIAETYFYDKKVKFHLDLASLIEKLPLIHPRRLVLTHMGSDMLFHLADIPYESAEDGKVLELQP
jgi:ribonuclease BN (tRNA processing enzyme)